MVTRYRISRSRGKEYRQLVRVYRDPNAGGKVKTEVLAHLGDLTDEQALTYWPKEIALLRETGRPEKADRLERYLGNLRQFAGSGKDQREAMSGTLRQNRNPTDEMAGPSIGQVDSSG